MMVQRIVPDDGNRMFASKRVLTEANALKRMNIRGGMEYSLVFQAKSNIRSTSKLGNLPRSWCIKSLEAISIPLPSVDVLWRYAGKRAK